MAVAYKYRKIMDRTRGLVGNYRCSECGRRTLALYPGAACKDCFDFEALRSEVAAEAKRLAAHDRNLARLARMRKISRLHYAEKAKKRKAVLAEVKEREEEEIRKGVMA